MGRVTELGTLYCGPQLMESTASSRRLPPPECKLGRLWICKQFPLLVSQGPIY